MTRLAMPLDFIIDKITHSIECKATGEKITTEILPFQREDLKAVLKKYGWKFTWKKEWGDPDKEVYKLLIEGDTFIQGLISFSIKSDHIALELIESAPPNIGEHKRFLGIAGNLIAFACKRSFEKGFDGYVAFIAKTNLINHYKNSLGAFHIGNQRMIINTEAAWNLVKQYYQ